MRAFILCFAVMLLGFCPAAWAMPDAGQPAPALIVKDLAGKTFDLHALKGKVVIVDFWATWCAPCREEMPILNAFYRKNHQRGLEMIGVSVDRSRALDDVKKAMQPLAYQAALLHDAETNGFGKPLALPVAYIIDKKGIIRERLMGDDTSVTMKSLSGMVDPLLR